MKTVVENNVGLIRQYSLSDERDYPTIESFGQERSCFYDYGARSSVEFSGFIDNGDSAFVDGIGKYFSQQNGS